MDPHRLFPLRNQFPNPTHPLILCCVNLLLLTAASHGRAVNYAAALIASALMVLIGHFGSIFSYLIPIYRRCLLSHRLLLVVVAVVPALG